MDGWINDWQNEERKETYRKATIEGWLKSGSMESGWERRIGRQKEGRDTER